MTARAFIGAGDIYINRIEGGVKQGLKGPYYANKFEIKPNVNLLEQKSKGKNDYGNVIESVALQDPAEFTLELSEVNVEGLTLALLGTTAAANQTSGALTAAVVTAGALDTWFSVGKEALAAGAITLTNSAGSTTYVEGTDYVANRDLGLIKPLSGGAIAASASLKITANYGATTNTKIAGGTKTDIRAEFVFDGKNLVDGLPVKVTVWEGVIAADSAFDFLADEFNNISLPGRMKIPVGKTEPFEVLIRTA